MTNELKEKQAFHIPALIDILMKLKSSFALSPPMKTETFSVNRWNLADAFVHLDMMLPPLNNPLELFPKIDPCLLMGSDFGRSDDVESVFIAWITPDAVQIALERTEKDFQKRVNEWMVANSEDTEVARPILTTPSAYLSAYGRFGRDTGFPVAQKTASRSYFFGHPWLPDDVDWPKNAHGEPLRFIMQVDFSEHKTLANVLGVDGILSLFYDANLSRDVPYVDDEQCDTSVEIFLFDSDGVGGIRTAPGEQEIVAQDSIYLGLEIGLDYPSDRHVFDRKLGTVEFRKVLNGFTDDGPGLNPDSFYGHPSPKYRLELLPTEFAAIWPEPITNDELQKALQQNCHRGVKVGGWPFAHASEDYPAHDNLKMKYVMQCDWDDPLTKEYKPRMPRSGTIFIDHYDTKTLRFRTY